MQRMFNARTATPTTTATPATPARPALSALSAPHAAPAAPVASARSARPAKMTFRRAMSLFLAIMVAMCFLNLEAFVGAAFASPPSSGVGLDLLLTGYNLFGKQELAAEHTKNNIFKPSAASNLSDLYMYQTNVSKTTGYSISARSMSEMQKKTNDQMGLSVSAEAKFKIAIVSAKVSASAKYSRSSSSDFSQALDTYFFEFGAISRLAKNSFKSWNSPATKQRVKAEVDEYFLDRLINERNIINIFNEFGTHFITSYTSGGTAGLSISIIEKKTSSAKASKSDLSTKVSAGGGAMGIEASAEVATNVSKELSTLSKDSRYDAKVTSFTNGGRGYIALSDDKTLLTNSITNWANSFKVTGPEANCSLLIDDQLQLVPIWELLPDGYENRKRQLQEEYQRLLIELDVKFNNEFIYKAATTGDASAPVTVHASGAPAANTSGRIEISRANQFINIGTRDYPASGNYVLTANIDLEGQKRFETMNSPFTGTLDGNGYTISNFNTDKSFAAGVNYGGLFMENKGTIKNLFIKDSSITVKNESYTSILDNVGLLTGVNSGTIENVQVENSKVEYKRKADAYYYTILNEQFNIGGIAGTNANNATISKCSFTGKASGMAISADVYASQGGWTKTGGGTAQANLGGIAGVSGGTVADCYTDVPVKGKCDFAYTGGGCARPYCYAGGIVGVQSAQAKLERCFSVGSTSASKNNDWGEVKNGSLIGYRSNKNTLKDVFVRSNQSGIGGTSSDTAGNSGSVTSVTTFKKDHMVDILVANGWIDSLSYDYPRLPGIKHEFDVYYKGSIPQYPQGFVFPTKLSDNMKVYFGGVKDITDEVTLRYNFNDIGKRKIQLTYVDDAGSLFTGDFEATVVEAQADFDFEPAKPTGPDAPVATPTPAATGAPAASPGAGETPAPTAKPTAKPTPTAGAGTGIGTGTTATAVPFDPSVNEYDAATDGKLNGIKLYATVTEVGVKFDWIPGGSKLGYRIYRSTVPGDDGISISDFPIMGSQFVDVNVKADTQYYYMIRKVEAEASYDPDTYEVIDEAVGDPGESLPVMTGNIVTKDTQRQFILMKIAKDTMQVNENTVEIDPGRGTTPLVVDSRTLVPIRAIIETMGGTVGWDASAPDDIALSAYGHNIKMVVDSDSIVVDGETKGIDVPPQVINSRTMVPVRFVAENVGCNIQWIGSTQEIIIVFYGKKA